MSQVTQISIGRFHHFHLARQLERFGLLKEIWTGYPKFKLKDEQGIPREKIRTFPWIQTPYMAMGRIPALTRATRLREEMSYWAQKTLDEHVAASLREPTTLFALSGNGLTAGAKAQALGGRYICDRGSAHIRYQEDILREEYKRWGLEFRDFDPRILAREEAEYEQADLITVPSGFVERSFIEMGIPAEKLRRIPYGGRLDRFYPQGEPDPNFFTALFVGAVSLQKGIPYLLEGFAKMKHPQKRLRIVGAMQGDVDQLLNRLPTEHVEFYGTVANSELPLLYSTSDVFVLPSVQEGFGMVMGEALACGCPVIASNHTGAEDLFAAGEEGFILPVRDSIAIADALQIVADSNGAFRKKARYRIANLGGWDRFGEYVKQIILDPSANYAFEHIF